MNKQRIAILGGKVRQSGFTLIELMVVLAIGIGIYIIAGGKTDIAFGTSDVAEEISNLNTLQTNVRLLKTTSGYGASGSDLTAQLVTNKGVPANMTVTGGVLYNVYGGAVVPTSTGVGYQVVENGIPSDACMKIATRQSKAGTWNSIRINSGAVITGEVTSAVAQAQCTGAGNTNVVTLISAT